MPGYVEAALHRFQHSVPTKPQHSPYQATLPQYGVKVQYIDELDTSPLLPKSAITRNYYPKYFLKLPNVAQGSWKSGGGRNRVQVVHC
jgi:hypothetical protein